MNLETISAMITSSLISGKTGSTRAASATKRLVRLSRSRYRVMPLHMRIIAWVIICTQVLSPVSDKFGFLSSAFARDKAPSTESDNSPKKAPGVPNHTLPQFELPSVALHFSDNPTDGEFLLCHVFREPLMPIGSATTPEENKALAGAITHFVARINVEDVSSLNAFLTAYPTSAWRAALLLNVGKIYREHGYISRALGCWEEGWKLAASETRQPAATIGNQMAGELAELYGRLGRMEALGHLLDQTKGRGILGLSATKINAAQQGLLVMKHHPEKGFLCGPAALQSIRMAEGDKEILPSILKEARSTTNGTSLEQLNNWAGEMGMNMQPAKRGSNADIPLPAIIHWKAGHFAAILKKQGNRFLMKDPVFEQQIWMSKEAIDDESSGYFLVAGGTLPVGWESLDARAAGNIWGKGDSPMGPKNYQRPNDPNVQPCPTTHGMALYNVKAMLASLTVFDTPLSYQPPRGPAIEFNITYDEYDMNDFNGIGGFGPNFSFNYYSYITYGDYYSGVDLFVRGGGKESYSGFDTNTMNYVMQTDSKAILHANSASNFVRYLPDGSQEIFDLATMSGVFLTKIVDPQGNTNSISYDSNYRPVAITDAIGQVSTIQYVSPISTNWPWFYRISQISDPFTNAPGGARTTSFTYDPVSTSLIKITDEIGLESQFGYSNGLMSTLTTPYGTTSFTYSNQVNDSGVISESVEVTDPEGNHELTYFYGDENPAMPFSDSVAPSGIATGNGYLNARTTYFWDKHAMQVAPGDFSQAKLFHWLHQSITPPITGHILESVKMPLESRIWYNYANQVASVIEEIGITNSQPTAAARVLDDGTTQLYQYAYSNQYGNLTMAVDPVGRTNFYIYDTNDIDLVQILQANGTNNDILKTITYNSQHRPLAIVDASGQTNFYVYNSFGQITVATNALGQTVTMQYDANGYLTNINGSLPGATNSYTYDSCGRVFTSTDANGYTLTFYYDNLDRGTKIMHPDGTCEQTIYDRLDSILQQDRRGHWTAMTYDSLRRVRDVRDSLNRVTHFEWCGCGSLESITDPMGKTTSWTRDIEGRSTAKSFPDASQIRYCYGANSGRLASVTDANNQTSLYNYFADNNLSQVSYSNAIINTPTVSFTYDPSYNRMLAMVDGIGTTTYSYNAVTVPPTLGANMLAGVANPAALGNSVITYQYDALGRVTQRAIDGVAVQRTFDALGRMTQMTNILGTFSNAYVGDTFRLGSVSYPNGQGTSFSYFDTNNDLRLQTILHTNSNGGTISQFDYTYDADGQIKTWTRQADTASNNTFTFNYDPVDQLLGAVLAQTGMAANILNQYVYSYDSSGNRTGQQSGAATSGANYNNLNQLYSIVTNGMIQFGGNITKTGAVTVAGVSALMTNQTNFSSYIATTNGTNRVQIAATDLNLNIAATNYLLVVTNNSLAATLVYDLNGNLVTNMTAAATNTYEWDAENRLTAINEGGTNRSEFAYDGAGRRVQIVEKTNGLAWSTKMFVWCKTELCEERNSTGNSVTKRFFGQGEQISGTNYYFTRDHLGSVREMIDATGTIHARYDYDPYGISTKVSGDMDVDFTFTGHYLHVPSGIYLTPFRAYDATMGRWLSRDPFAENMSINLYAYVDDNPINGKDPFGLWNLWNPATWGVQTGGGTSLLNSLNPFDGSAGWGGFSLETTSEADAAFLDGINPFGNPLAQMGLYDPCDSALRASRTVGTWTLKVEGALGVMTAAFWAPGTSIFYSGAGAEGVATELAAAGEGSTIFDTVGGSLLRSLGVDSRGVWTAASWFYANATGAEAIAVVGEGGGLASSVLGATEFPVLAARGVNVIFQSVLNSAGL